MPVTPQKSGMFWEKALEVVHYRWMSSGRALVYHNHPRVTIQRSRKGQIVGARFDEKGPPDYTVLSQGMMLSCEAKKTQKPRWRFSSLMPHQAHGLTMADIHGGLGLLLINTPDGSFCVPWDLVHSDWERWNRGQAKRGEASMTGEQLAELCIASAERRAPLDYLGNALDYLGERRA